MTFRAEPFGTFVDDLISSLTGGVTRERFVFLDEQRPFQLAARASVLAATVRIHGLANDAYLRFRNGIDFAVDTDGVIGWFETAPNAPAAGAVLPDPGTSFWASYERAPDPAAPPPLTDRNAGSVTRTLAESFAREYAVLSRQLEQVYDAAFLETATGRDLEAVADLLGLVRRNQRFARGEIVFSRTSPAGGDIHVPAGTRVSSTDVPAVTVETTDDVTLRRGDLSVASLVSALVDGAAGVAQAGALRVLNRPILGVDQVVNPQPLAFASATETDDGLRRRCRRALDHSGRSTVGAVVGALTTVDGIREQDIFVDEDHVAHAGLVKVTVASDLDPQQQALAAAALEEARPAGIRFEHNLIVPPPPAEVFGPGGGATPGPVAVPIITDEVFFPVGVTAVVTPADADLIGPQKASLVNAVIASIEGFMESLGVGEVIVYNKLVTAILAVPGGDDVTLDIYPAQTPPTGRQNLFAPSARRPRLDFLDVTLRGALIALDVTVVVERLGIAAALDPVQALANARDSISARLAEVLPTLTPTITPELLFGSLDVTEDYRPEQLSYLAEFVDEGLRIIIPDRQISPASDEQPWLRSVTVGERTQVTA